MSEFVHLHCHSAYSLLDGLNFAKPMVARAKELGMTALALTDHGRMSGALEFYLECKKQGIKPIIGCEVYLAHRTAQEPSGPTNPTDHLLLLCQNETGYRNLCRMLTIAEKPPYFSMKPRVDLELLSQYSEGLICSSACVMGPIGRHLAEPRIYDRSKKEYAYWDKDVDAAVRYAGLLKEIFPGRFFVEVMDHSSTPQDLQCMDPECRDSYDEALRMERSVLDNARHIAMAAGVPWVATNDCHFLSPDKHRAHDVLVQINTKRANKSNVLRSGLTQLYLKSAEEMNRVFGHYPDLLSNTLWIAEQCELEIADSSFKIPKFELPYEMQDTEHPSYQYMVNLAIEGAKVRYGDPVPEDVMARLKREADTIRNIGVCDYMLIVADFVNWAKQQGIRVGAARGSAGGSAISYCLGITGIDPLRHGLIFERFMNPDRVSMPDIDIDFPPARVGEVIEYVKNKYGEDRVARIATFQTLETKAAIQKVAFNIFQMEDKRPEIFRMTKSLPEKQGNFSVPLEVLRKEHEGLKAWVNEDSKTRNELLDICQDIIGVKQAASAHAAGVLIGDKSLDNYLPLMVGNKERKEKDWDAMMHTQMPMDDLEEIGLLKMDFLVVDYLGVLDQAVAYVKKTQGIDWVFPEDHEETYDDPEVYALLQQGRTAGIFQIESDGMRRVCMKLQPENFEQLYAILALHRPGPMDMVDPTTGLTMEEIFIHRKRGWKEISYLLPEIAEILEPTFGVLVYQEQIIQIAQVVAGFTAAQADVLRKAVGKKIPEVVEKEKVKFIPAAVERGHDAVAIDRLWAEIETFARYGFNKSHTVGYSVTTYHTAYMKAHFRLEWMAALLTVRAHKDEYVRKYVDECARLGIPILHPDINSSCAGWIPEENSIRFGLRSIMGIDAAADKLVKIRRTLPEGRFPDLLTMIDTCHAHKFKQSDLDTLIQAGACDCWGKQLAMRKALADRWKVLDKRRKKKTQAVTTLFTERLEGLTEGPDLREADRLASNIELLSGCYAIDVPIEGSDVVHIQGIAPSFEVLERIIEIALTRRGNTPLLVGVPGETGATLWIHAAKVRDTADLRKELQAEGYQIT